VMGDSDRKLNILFVSSDKHPPFRPAARAIFGEEMMLRGHRIDWLLQAQCVSNKPQELPLGDGFVYVGPTDDGASRWHRLRKHLMDLRNDCRMFSLARKNNYDLIQVKDKYISALLAIVVAKLNHTKLFYWIAFPHAEASIHNAREGIARYRIFYFIRGKFLKLILYRIIMPAADHIFVQSEQMKIDIAGEGISKSKMTPVPGSVNLENIPYEKPVAEVLPTKQVRGTAVVYLGTLSRMRRLDFIIRAFGKVLEEIPDARLYLLGKGNTPEDEEFMKAEVSRLGIEDTVEFVGFIPMDEAWEYIRKAAVCLSPYYPTFTLLSTSPTKLIEYMAMGKPVVGNDHPEQRLVIEESQAGICTPWEENAFAQAIVKIASDSNLAREMGIRGRRYVEQNRTNSLLADVVEKEFVRVVYESGPHAVPDVKDIN